MLVSATHISNLNASIEKQDFVMLTQAWIKYWVQWQYKHTFVFLQSRNVVPPSNSLSVSKRSVDIFYVLEKLFWISFSQGCLCLDLRERKKTHFNFKKLRQQPHAAQLLEKGEAVALSTFSSSSHNTASPQTTKVHTRVQRVNGYIHQSHSIINSSGSTQYMIRCQSIYRYNNHLTTVASHNLTIQSCQDK